jgi:murein DD-endopeptidase MepM/ murein hydrolase activator NlpD
MKAGKYYNLMLVPDGVEKPVGIRMPAWMFKALVVLVVLVLISLIVFFYFYGDILARAAVTDRLREENEVLKRYKYKLSLLEENMEESRKIVSRISQLAGVEFNFPELPPDSIIFASIDAPQPATIEHAIGSSDKCPQGLPLEGFITRGFSDKTDDYHPGIDIAAATGKPVLATASGKVSFADYDSTYGYMVIIEHENDVSTVYGHNSELLVATGKEVLVGGRIALSGNSGISSAPHLHYEIRENGKPVNPLKYIKDHEISLR